MEMKKMYCKDADASWGSAARPIGWQDAPINVALTLPQGTALKRVGLRWNRKIEGIGFRVECTLSHAPKGAFAMARMSPRHVILALAYAEAERVTAACDPDYWGGKLEALDGLIDILRKTRDVLGF